MNSTMVSIIIPVYNGANYLADAIDSALAQTYENKEIIVVNDGSKDDGATERVALAYGDRIRYYSKENGGVSTALNCAIAHANGAWISWLSHDDFYTTDKVAEQMKDVERLQAEGIDVLHTMFYCGGGYADANGNQIERKLRKIPDGLYPGRDMLYEMFSGYGIGGCGLLMPRAMFQELGGFDERMRFMQDMFMWERAFLAGYDFYVNNKVMSITRVHGMQTSTTGRDFGLQDREKVGAYLAEHLDGVTTTDGKDVLKQYLFLCMRNQSLNVGGKIYDKLSTQKRLSIREKCFFKLARIYGWLRKLAVKLYYRIRFNTKR